MRLIDEYDAAREVARLSDDRMEFRQKLSTWPTFGNGWAARMERIRELALKGAHRQPSPMTDMPEPKRLP